MLFNEVYQNGYYVRLEGMKKPLIVTEVGKHYMKAEGVRGSRWFICGDMNKIVALNIRTNVKREVLTPSKFVVLWNDGTDQDFFKSPLMDEMNKDEFIEALNNVGIRRIIVKEFKE